MKILFSPSEGKIKPTAQTATQDCDFSESSHLCRATKQGKHATQGKARSLPGSPAAEEAIKAYVDFLSTASEREICQVFGTKHLELDELTLSQTLLTAPRLRAISLYNGVGYKALDFASLPQEAQEYLLKHLIIFSNLFGAVSAKEPLPYYNLHQGKGKGAFELKTLYKAQQESLEELLSCHEVLDLRAQAYIKAYEPRKNPQSHYQVQFLKNGKAVSHYAKFYRGIYARTIALSQIHSLAELESLEIENLKLKSKEIVKNISVLTYEVLG